MELDDIIMRPLSYIYVDSMHYSSHMYLTLPSISGKLYIVNKDLRGNSLNKLASVDLALEGLYSITFALCLC
jgi:hypothetical protein